MNKRKKIFLIVILLIAISQLILLAFLIYFNWGTAKKAEIGVTFSPYHARYFGLDPKQVLRDSLDDLKIKKYRLAANWDVVEQKPGKYYFGDLDWQLNQIEKRNGSVVLAIGRRLPRWPECHDPKWIKGMNEKKIQTRVLNLLKVLVNKYKDRDIISAWQVENEPLLSVFGKCPAPDIEFLKKEIELVRSLDSRPIILTESGELSNWTNAALLADMVGVSIYKTTWSKGVGISSYPLTSIYYKHRARTIRPLVKKVFVSELQAEPWARGSLLETPILEQKIFIDEKKLKKSINFAKKAGFNEIYLWGIEWWAWLKKQGDSSMWNTVKAEVQENR